jgi:hypothetical protein
MRKKGDIVKLAVLARRSLPISPRIPLFSTISYNICLRGGKSNDDNYTFAILYTIKLPLEVLWRKGVGWLRYP